MQRCKMCPQPATHACRQCLNAFYCSQACADADWVATHSFLRCENDYTSMLEGKPLWLIFAHLTPGELLQKARVRKSWRRIVQNGHFGRYYVSQQQKQQERQAAYWGADPEKNVLTFLKSLDGHWPDDVLRAMLSKTYRGRNRVAGLPLTAWLLDDVHAARVLVRILPEDDLDVMSVLSQARRFPRRDGGGEQVLAVYEEAREAQRHAARGRGIVRNLGF